MKINYIVKNPDTIDINAADSIVAQGVKDSDNYYILKYFTPHTFTGNEDYNHTLDTNKLIQTVYGPIFVDEVSVCRKSPIFTSYNKASLFDTVDVISKTLTLFKENDRRVTMHTIDEFAAYYLVNELTLLESSTVQSSLQNTISTALIGNVEGTIFNLSSITPSSLIPLELIDHALEELNEHLEKFPR